MNILDQSLLEESIYLEGTFHYISKETLEKEKFSKESLIQLLNKIKSDEEVFIGNAIVLINELNELNFDVNTMSIDNKTDCHQFFLVEYKMLECIGQQNSARYIQLGYIINAYEKRLSETYNNYLENDKSRSQMEVEKRLLQRIIKSVGEILDDGHFHLTRNLQMNLRHMEKHTEVQELISFLNRIYNN